MVDHLTQAHEFRAGLHKAAELIARAEPDAVIVIGSNHFRGFFLDLMPAITIGVGRVPRRRRGADPGKGRCRSTPSWPATWHSPWLTAASIRPSRCG